jgi:hypothetical protein
LDSAKDWADYILRQVFRLRGEKIRREAALFPEFLAIGAAICSPF